jgi:hypothetical protein
MLAARLSRGGRVENRRVGRVRDHDGIDELDSHGSVGVEAEPGLEHRRVRELGVRLRDSSIGAIVEAAIEADRPVHAVHHADVRTHEAAQPAEVEVERVEQAALRLTRDPVLLDVQPATPELRLESAHELVSAARRGRHIRVEHRKVGAAVARRAEVALGADTRAQAVERRPRMDGRGARLGPESHLDGVR